MYIAILYVHQHSGLDTVHLHAHSQLQHIQNPHLLQSVNAPLNYITLENGTPEH